MKVKFVPQNVEFEIKPGQSVMHVAQDHDLYVKSVCKGVPSCAECRVRIIDGEHNVLPPGSEELSLIGTGHFIDRRRLSCQLKCFGDITVDMSEQIAKQSGLIGGQKKKKLAVKDDRIEDARAIRASVREDGSVEPSEDSSDESGAESDEGAAVGVSEEERSTAQITEGPVARAPSNARPVRELARSPERKPEAARGNRSTEPKRGDRAPERARTQATERPQQPEARGPATRPATRPAPSQGSGPISGESAELNDDNDLDDGDDEGSSETGALREPGQQQGPDGGGDRPRGRRRRRRGGRGGQGGGGGGQQGTSGGGSQGGSRPSGGGPTAPRGNPSGGSSSGGGGRGPGGGQGPSGNGGGRR